MKTYLIVIFSIISIKLFAQENINGSYHDYFGSQLRINPDSTFIYKWSFDLASSWSKGSWKLKNDTIYFTIVPVLDTLKLNGKIINSLVLSIDERSESISMTDNLIYQLASGGQNRRTMTNKLYFQKGKLFVIAKNGNLIKKKVKGFGTNKKYVPWYVRKEK